jgi:hypothetical protein
MRQSRWRHESALAYARALGTTESCDSMIPETEVHMKYTSSTSSVLLLVFWLRCRHYHRGYFRTSSPPQAYRGCTGGRLQPVSRWGLRSEAAPAGMLSRREGLA